MLIQQGNKEITFKTPSPSPEATYSISEHLCTEAVKDLLKSGMNIKNQQVSFL